MVEARNLVTCCRVVHEFRSELRFRTSHLGYLYSRRMSAFLYLNVDGGKRMKKRFLKVITTIVTVIIATFLVLVGYLTITEFKYPVRIANLKRCLMVNRVPVEKSDKELVLVNLHLEAYDDGEGKIEQTGMLKEYLRQEVDKGNYVIAAGDFNQVFSGIDEDLYPIINEDYWKPGVIDTTEFGEDLHFEVDGRIPSCRLLNEPYDYDNKDNFQHYLIDGYIVSSNIEVKSVETLNLKFKNADHNPVLLKLKLK